MSFSTGTVGTWLIKKACEKGFENIVKDIDTDNLNKKFNHIVEKVGTKLQIKYPEILGGSIETFFKEEVIINELIKMLFINSRIDIETIKENFDNTTLPENFIKEFIYELKSALLKDIEFNHILSNNQIFISILEIDENINTLVDNSTNSTKQLRKILNLLEKNISNTINEEMSCCKNDTIEFKKLYKIHCFINIDNATIIFLYNGINLLLNSETQKLHHIENEFVVEGNEIEEICELAIKIYEYLLYFDWKKHGHVRPPHIQISITEKESIDIANNIYEYISLNLSEILYKQLSNDKQKLFASENNYYVFIKERLYGNVLRDYCFYQRDIILRRFSFLWLLADQLTRGSWGNSVAILDGFCLERNSGLSLE